MTKFLLGVFLLLAGTSAAAAQQGGDSSISSLGSPFNSQSPNNFWLEEERRREARSRGEIFRPGRAPAGGSVGALYGETPTPRRRRTR